MTTQLALASARINRNPPPRPADATVVLAEFPINNSETFRAEVVTLNRRTVISVSRWRSSPTGPRRAGPAFEFAVHRLHVVTRLLADVENLMRTHQKFADCSEIDLDGDEALARDAAAVINYPSKGGAR